MIDAVLESGLSTMLSKALSYDPPAMRHLTKLVSLAYDVRERISHGPCDRALPGLPAQQSPPSARCSTARPRANSRAGDVPLRVAYLQGRQLNGLVQVNWQAIERALESEVSGPIAMAAANVCNEQDDAKVYSYIDDVSRTFGSKISAFVIANNPDEIKTTISSSLRHNQLHNRFRMAFDKAIVNSIAYDIDIETTFGKTTTTSSGRRISWLRDLRDKLMLIIDHFNDDFLDVRIGSPFSSRLASIFTEQLRAHLSDAPMSELVFPLLSTRSGTSWICYLSPHSTNSVKQYTLTPRFVKQ